jgi:hypothetical protein
MNDDTILQLGGFCTELLSSEEFDALTKLYSQQCAFDLLNTAPHEQKAREGIYAQYRGFEEFLSMLQAASKKHADLLAKQQQEADPDEQHLSEIDDDRVHDIYGNDND